MGFSNYLILCFLVAQHGICISLSTLKRILRRLHLRRRRNYTPLRYVWRCLRRELHCSGSLMGYRAMHQRLRGRYGVRIPRDVVAAMLAAVDPVGVRQRSKRRLVRRHYYLKGPNYCWHVDGLDKLKTYGFAVHGCIDGFSRKILWLEVSKTNNDSSVIAGYFLEAVAKYGCARIVRCDRGTENSKIAFLQPFLRRNCRDTLAGVGSFQYGRSASNQRIEALWSQLRKWFTFWWMGFFQMLKEIGEYDETNPIHLDCIRFSFIGFLQNELDEVRTMWNHHLIRHARSELHINGIPDELYYIPELRGFRDYKCAVNDRDLQYCSRFVRKKPQPVPSEFTELAEILMHDNNWVMPSTCYECLTLYLNLKSCIEEWLYS